MQNHGHGIAYGAFAANPSLDNFFDVLTLSIDRQDAVYVSTMEARKYPIYATQWHPEKNAFEWTPDLDIPHEPEAVEITQEVANFLMGAARKNHHRPESREDEEDLLIYNWQDGLRYSGKRKYEGEEVAFDEIYIFPEAKKFVEVKGENRGS
jgi:gamma-glutamyl hydrolase